MDYLIDGTFIGLLSVLKDLFDLYTPETLRKKEHRIYDALSYQGSLFSLQHLHPTCHESASYYSAAIIQQYGPEFYEVILKAFLSEDPNRSNAILDFLVYANQFGAQVINHMQHPDVYPLRTLNRAVERECHLLLGLMRFEKLNGDIFYAPCAPTYNVIILMAHHFSNRLSDQLWVIHDTKRNIGLFYNKETWYTDVLEKAPLGGLHDEELAFQSHWKAYHQRIAIKERTNPNLQMQHMPKKYWKYLTEMR